MRPSQGSHPGTLGNKLDMQNTLPIYALRHSPSASISSLAQLEALTKTIFRNSSGAPAGMKNKAPSKQLEPDGDSQVQRQSDDQRPGTGTSHTNSQRSLGTGGGREGSVRGETLITPAESSCAYETEGWEGDDEMEDDDNDTDIVEVKMVEAEGVDEMQLDGIGADDDEPARDLPGSSARASGETQRALPAAPTASVGEEGMRRSPSAKKRSRTRTRKGGQPWAWRCFLWCCVVERLRSHG